MYKEIIRIEQIALVREKSEESYLKYLTDPKINHAIAIGYLANNAFSMAKTFVLLREKYSSKYKSLAFSAGLNYNYISEEQTSENEYYITMQDLCSLFFSDNIKVYSILNKNKRYNIEGEKRGWQAMETAMFQIADSDWDGLKETKLYLESIKRPDDLFHDINIYYDIYDGFLRSDKNKLENALNALENPEFRKVRQKMINEEKYISIITTALAKLAWMHGMEVNIRSEFVPPELLPFEPLSEYTIPYKFLRDYYREKGYNWRYNPVHPDLQDWENDEENPNKTKNNIFGKLFKK